MASGWSPCAPKYNFCKVTGRRLDADSTHSFPVNLHPSSLQQPAIVRTTLSMAFRGKPRAQVNFKCEDLLKALLCMLNLQPLQNASQTCNTDPSRALKDLANDDR